jgi:hypothetical protein
MADDVVAYSWHTSTPRLRNVLSLGLIAACVMLSAHARSVPQALLAALFGWGAVAVQLDQSISVNKTGGHVDRTISLLGHPMWSSHWDAKDFSAVGTYRLRGGDPKAPVDLVHVGLRRASGTILAIRYFSTGPGEPCPEADTFAQDLERALFRRDIA